MNMFLFKTLLTVAMYFFWAEPFYNLLIVIDSIFCFDLLDGILTSQRKLTYFDKNRN